MFRKGWSNPSLRESSGKVALPDFFLDIRPLVDLAHMQARPSLYSRVCGGQARIGRNCASRTRARKKNGEMVGF